MALGADDSSVLDALPLTLLDELAPPRAGIPLPVMRVVGAVGGGISRVLRKDSVVTPTSVRLMHVQTALDHGRARRELG